MFRILFPSVFFSIFGIRLGITVATRSCRTLANAPVVALQIKINLKKEMLTNLPGLVVTAARHAAAKGL